MEYGQESSTQYTSESPEWWIDYTVYPGTEPEPVRFPVLGQPITFDLDGKAEPAKHPGEIEGYVIGFEINDHQQTVSVQVANSSYAPDRWYKWNPSQ